MHKAALVGAGQIAAGFDDPSSPHVLTHCHALALTAGVQTVGIYDVRAEAAQAAAKKWNIPAFASFESLLKLRPDLVVVCVPDEQHTAVLEQVLEYRPRLVVCEKPLATNWADAQKVVAAYREAGCALAVNYQRRYEDKINDIKQEKASGALGRFLTGTVNYSKGIRHNGSHAVDCLRYLLGEPTAALTSRRVTDYSEADPTIDGVLEFAEGQVHFAAGDERQFSLFEIDLVFEKARFRLWQGGVQLERWSVKADPVFPGYRELLPEPSVTTSFTRSLLGMTQELVGFLDGKNELRIRAEAILNTQRVCDTLATAPLWEKVSLKESGL